MLVFALVATPMAPFANAHGTRLSGESHAKENKDCFPIISLDADNRLCSGQYVEVKNALLISATGERWIAARLKSVQYLCCNTGQRFYSSLEHFRVLSSYMPLALILLDCIFAGFNLRFNVDSQSEEK